MKSGFESISDSALEQVSGGTGTTSTNTSSSASNDQLVTAVQGIQSSLKDLGSNQNQGLFSGPNGGLMLGMMAMAMQRRNTTVVYGGRGGGYYWQSSW